MCFSNNISKLPGADVKKEEEEKEWGEEKKMKEEVEGDKRKDDFTKGIVSDF